MDFELEPDECTTCMGAHDNGIHDATVRLHGWMRAEINRKLVDWRAQAAAESARRTEHAAA